jgi:hypothetical protein
MLVYTLAMQRPDVEIIVDCKSMREAWMKQ